ncbi:hypothetical protein AFL01nite_01620 [Aeromicrobium flavum]|uniref:Uncharacterized protein n=1 Tax=Aeromicrobium flavum TaxID=416568 RepID=A0A512HQV6_9ACTN|nr:hypothetical protein AFL01nite_01620 [Aeromicrobium flavum]
MLMMASGEVRLFGAVRFDQMFYRTHERLYDAPPTESSIVEIVFESACRVSGDGGHAGRPGRR